MALFLLGLKRLNMIDDWGKDTLSAKDMQANRFHQKILNNTQYVIEHETETGKNLLGGKETKITLIENDIGELEPKNYLQKRFKETDDSEKYEI